MPLPRSKRTKRHTHPENDPNTYPPTPDLHGTTLGTPPPTTLGPLSSPLHWPYQQPTPRKLWKGAWTTNPIASFTDTARANTAATTTPPRFAPQAPPCQRPRTFASFRLPTQILLISRHHQLRPSSLNRTGGHCTGTSGKTKTSALPHQ